MLNSLTITETLNIFFRIVFEIFWQNFKKFLKSLDYWTSSRKTLTGCQKLCGLQMVTVQGQVCAKSLKLTEVDLKKKNTITETKLICWRLEESCAEEMTHRMWLCATGTTGPSGSWDHRERTVANSAGMHLTRSKYVQIDGWMDR